MFILAALALQAAPAPPTKAEQAEIKRYFDAELLDGPSARWKWPARVSKGSYCGWVNAKNRMGAYTGWKPFYFIKLDNGKPAGGIAGSASSVMFEYMCTTQGYDLKSPPRD